MKLTDSSLAFAGSNAVRAIASSSPTSNQFMVYGDTTITKVLSGTGIGLVKNGLGVLTLSAANTYTGNTTISSGILTITNTSALPGYNTNGRFAVAPNATLAVYNAVSDSDVTILRNTTNFAASANLGFDTTSGNRTYTPLLSNTSQGALGIVKLGSNTLTLTSTNTYTGQTNVLAGTLYAGTANVIPDSSPVNIASGATLSLNGSETIATLSGAGTLNTSSQLLFNSNNNATFNGVLSSNYYPPNAFTITYKTGTGTQTFSGATIRFGDPSIPSSSCALRHDTGGITILGGTFTQTLSDNGQNTPRNYQMGINSGTTTALTVAQSGTMNVKGIMLGENNTTSNNTISLSSGGTIINAGETWFSGASGTMNINGGLYSSQFAFEIGGGTGSVINNVNISNNGILRANHSFINMSRVSGSVNTINITSGGILSAGSFSVLGGVNANSNVINFDNGTYSPNANNITTNTSSFATYKIKSGGATFNIPSGWTNTFNPNLVQDATSTGGGLVKTGAGQLTFGGTGSTYTGQLSVLEGTFSVASVNNNSANGVFGNSTLPIVLGSNGKTATLQYTAAASPTTTKGVILPLGAIGTFDITGNAGTGPRITGIISGSGSLVKTGIGLLSYGGDNTYSGGTTLTNGLNIVGSDSAFGTGSVYFKNGSLRSTTGRITTLSNNFFLNPDTGVLTFPNVAGEKSLILAGPITLARQVTFNVTVGASVATEALIISGPIGDGGNAYQLNKTGTGVLVLSGQNTFSGPIIIQVGKMRILYPTIGDIRTTSGDLQFASGITNDISSSIRNNTQAVRIDTNGQNVTFASLLSSNSAGLTKLGTGTLTLSTTPIGANPNGIRGTITANAGQLTLTGTLSTASRIYVSNGAGTSGTLSISGALIQTANPGGGPRNFQVAPTAGVTGTVNVYSGGTLRSAAGGGIMLGENGGGTGIMNIYGGDVRLDSNNFWFSGPTATLSMSAGTFTAPNMYLAGGTGPQSIFNMRGGTATLAGSLILGQTNAGIGILNLDGGLFQAAATVVNTVSAHVLNFNGGTFRMTGNTTITTTPILVVKSGGCIFEQTANTTTINGILSSQGVDGGLTKLGSGLLVLNAINTYTGTTAISAGTLRVLKKISGTGSDASFNQANFGLSTLGVTFNSIPNIGDTYKLFPTSTVNNYSSITLTGATGRTATYDSSNSTLTIA
jgi:autotransporter-associated beta strand protein